MIIINIESSPSSTVSELPAHNDSYSVYEASSNDTPFSAGFIASLTVDQCSSLFLPSVLPPNTVRLVGWSKTVPSASSINFQLLGAFIPCGEDIRTFLGDQEQQYKVGFHAVVLEYNGSFCCHESILGLSNIIRRVGDVYTVHYSLVRLWHNCLSLQERVGHIKAVLNAIQTSGILSPDDYELLLSCRVNTPLQGFPLLVTLTLSTLHELLGETWLGESILDARAHLFESSLNATLPNSIHILPAFFHQELSLAFEHQKFTKRFRLLRDLLLQNPPTYLAFVYNKHGVHWAPCLISLKDRVIFHGDSLEWEADDNMCRKVQWLFGDVTEIQDQWREDILPISSQSPGSGSCGVAALSAIASFLDHGLPLWTQSESQQFRCAWMSTILQAHCQSVRQKRSRLKVHSLVS